MAKLAELTRLVAEIMARTGQCRPDKNPAEAPYALAESEPVQAVSLSREPADLPNQVLSALKNNSVVLVHGRAGTGKTTLVRTLLTRCKGRAVVVAPTGIAALNSGGQTIHSFFGFPPGMFDRSEIKCSHARRSIVNSLNFLVIDEVSMVRADLVDAIDYSLRLCRGSNRPFGGLPILMSGDFLQLPPIVEEDDEPILLNLGYESPFAFGAKCLQGIEPKIFELDTVYRQSEQIFIELLAKIRLAEDLHASLDALNSLCVRSHRSTHHPILLTPTRAAADRYNDEGLLSLPGEPVHFHGVIEGQFGVSDRRNLPAPEFLLLKSGARVLFTKNDTAHRWVNGTLGTVCAIRKEAVTVRLDESGNEYDVTPETWENTKYAWDANSRSVRRETVGKYTQLPLTPAWAITIHKSQGLTLSDVRLDLADGAFSPGQVYVALSRAKTLSGLSLRHPIRVGDIHPNVRLTDAVRRFTGPTSAP